MERFQAWGSVHPVAVNIVYLAVFLVDGTVTSAVLNGRVPWPELALSVVVWVLITVLARRRTRRYQG